MKEADTQPRHKGFALDTGFMASSAGRRLIVSVAWVSSITLAFFLGALEAQTRWEAAASAASQRAAVYQKDDAPLPPGGWVVGSLNGRVYHLPWCPGAARLAPEKTKWFASEAQARAAGYRPAKNCPGLPEQP
ncbi:hypothetical protein D6792_03435 [Candidatus Parcubacteria bacterium]|nr:MAG: hypothetical protein D6792_03435 [Candidatus Parcubacteria bacterium]GIW69022.1 MAG: hypothetical protein KatS3mg100_516 [Candidatus Parcubacteria bacterium]